MSEFESYHCGRCDWPVSTVKPRSQSRSDLARQLEEFEQLDLSAPDRGFLRLAQAVLSEQLGSQTRLGADWNSGLIS